MLESESGCMRASELATEIRQHFGELTMKVSLPAYLPPAIVGRAEAQWVERALHLAASIAEPDDYVVVSGWYQDARETFHSRVVISVRLQRKEFEQKFYADVNWLSELDAVRCGLLEQSVDFEAHADRDGFALDFSFRVYGSGAASGRHRNTVLLVEDDAFVRQSTAEVLEMQGYRVLSATTADEALAAFESHRNQIGLVFSDISLPGEDGQRLAARVSAVDPRMPILLTSGYARSVPTGFSRQVQFLAKPYNAEKVGRAVAQCLRATSVTGAAVALREAQAPY